MLRATHAPNRRAFTLVEMLVASALILMIMYILASCFQQALASFGQLRASGDLQERLRLASMIIRDDLKQDHFDGGTAAHFNDGKTLGSQRLDKGDWRPPDKGFFRIYQGSASDMSPNLPFKVGTDKDIDGLISNQVINHYLHFTVHLGGIQGTDRTATIQNGRDQVFQTQFLNQSGGPDQGAPGSGTAYDFYDADATTGRPSWVSPPYLKKDAPTWDATTNSFKFDPSTNTDPFLQRFFYTPWAEVAYYLRPSAQTAGGNPLYVLYRRQRLILDDTYVPSPANPPAPLPNYLPPKPNMPALVDLSFWQRPPLASNSYELNTPSRITVPQRRFGMDPGNPNNPVTVSGVYNDLQHKPTNFYFPIFADDAPPQYPNPPTANTNYGMGLTSNQAGDDILLSDVLSFEVKVDWTPPGQDPTPYLQAGQNPPPDANDFPTYAQPPYLWYYGTGTNQRLNTPRYNYTDSAGNPHVNPDYPFDDLPLPGGMNPNSKGTQGYNQNYVQYGNDVRVFDTWARQTDPLNVPPLYDFIGAAPAYPDSQKQEAWSTGYLEDHSNPPTITRPNTIRPTTIPLRIRVRALQIRIRIWDAKAKVVRQITIVQDV